MAQNKFEIVRLGDTKTVVTENKTVTTSVKAGLILIGGAALFFGVRAIVRNVKASQGARQTKVDKDSLSLEKSWYTNAANSLKTAFDAVITYDSETIEGIILQLKNADDWNQLQKQFGSLNGKSLPALINSMYFRRESCVNHIKQIGGGI